MTIRSSHAALLALAALSLAACNVTNPATNNTASADNSAMNATDSNSAVDASANNSDSDPQVGSNGGPHH
jgi:hypothetical protein